MELVFLYIFTSFFFITTVVVLFNFFCTPRFENLKYKKKVLSKVSVLIPVRNEEKIIQHTVESIVNQSYSNIEIIIVNDDSEDGTEDVLADLQENYPFLKVIKGLPLPTNWTGKNWACHQLSQHANGELLLFIDADCSLSPCAIESALSIIAKYSLHLLSFFPTQVMKSIPEKTIVPLMEWLLLTFLPLPMIYISSWLSFVAANGQFMLFSRQAYKEIGGHETVSDRIVDDMELAKNIKRKKLKMMTLLGNTIINCRMYSSFKTASMGFMKNFYAGFNTHPIIFICILFILAGMYVIPFILVIGYPIFGIFCAVILVQRLMLSLISRQNPLYNIILHPLQIIIMVWIGIFSMVKTKKGTLEWKGRKL